MAQLSNIVFYAFAAVTVALALVVVTSRNVFHGALALTGALAVVAGLFALLGADFLAATQVLVYVGGIMIIMLFVIMLSQQPADALVRQTNQQWLWGGLFAAALAGALMVHFRQTFSAVAARTGMEPTSAAIGRLILGDLLVPFEAVSLVLLAALVGAVVFGAAERPSKGAGR